MLCHTQPPPITNTFSIHPTMCQCTPMMIQFFIIPMYIINLVIASPINLSFFVRSDL